MRRDRAAAGAAVARALLVVLASLALLAPGVPELVRSGPSSVAATATPTPAASTSSDAPRGALVLRASGPAAVPAPSGPGDGLAPGTAPSVAPHLVARPQPRAPGARLTGSAAGAPGSRAPPGPAGT